MSQTEALALLNQLGGIAVAADLERMGMKYAAVALQRLKIWGYVDSIDSIISNGKGGRPRIYYTKE